MPKGEFMRLSIATIILSLLLAAGADAQPSRRQFAVPTRGGQVLVESFGDCAKPECPAVLILSGSKGFAAPAYDEIGQAFKAAGLNAYLVHLLSPDDLDAIATASGAHGRIAYSAEHLSGWIQAVQGVAAYLKVQPHSGGKIGILGISLGAQIASAASVGRSDIDALVLVDGGLPNGYSQPVRSFPPLLLIWGSQDRTFPLSTGQKLQRTVKSLGGPVTLDVYEGGAHDFLLTPGVQISGAARRSAAGFLSTYLSR
jgi:dienelactone hydrolase